MKIQIGGDIEAVRTAAKKRIDDEAELARLVYITTGSGQAMVYQAKEDEARSTLAGGGGTPPHLTAEAAVRGITVEQMATIVVQSADMWRQISALIEAKRISAKMAVDGAATIAEAAAAAKVDWTAI